MYSFKKFELNSDTYRRAASLAHKYGHMQRFKSLSDWSLYGGSNKKISNNDKVSSFYNLGPFNIKGNIYQYTFLDYHNKKKDSYTKIIPGLITSTRFNSDNSPIHTLLVKGPLLGYITDINFSFDEASQEDEEAGYGAFDIKNQLSISNNSKYLSIYFSLTILVDNEIYKIRNYNEVIPFVIRIPLSWNDDSFVLEELDIKAGTFDVPVFFSDRVSSIKFKKLVLNYLSKCDDLKDIFREFSSASEWTKLRNDITSININSLYNQR